MWEQYGDYDWAIQDKSYNSFLLLLRCGEALFLMVILPFVLVFDAWNVVFYYVGLEKAPRKLFSAVATVVTMLAGTGFFLGTKYVVGWVTTIVGMFMQTHTVPYNFLLLLVEVKDLIVAAGRVVATSVRLAVGLMPIVIIGGVITFWHKST